MRKKKEQQTTTTKEIEKMLTRQTVIILNAVDEKLQKTEEGFKKEISGLRISIDKFVELYTRQEQEFTIMKEHLQRLETRVAKLEQKPV